MDDKWWKVYFQKVKRGEWPAFEGLKTSTCRIAGVTWLHKLRHYNNSGAAAIGIAERAQAGRVILLGYDAAPDGRKVHWHGDHPKGLGNAGSMPKWPGLFRRVANDLKRLEIINCSRRTALNCFQRKSLEEALGAGR